MTLDEFMNFKGTDIAEYERLLEKRRKLEKQIKTLSMKIADEEDSLSVFEGELSERDKELEFRHLEERNRLVFKRDTQVTLLELTIKQIEELQGWRES